MCDCVNMEDIVEFNDRSILLRVKKAHVRNESFSHLCLNQQVAEHPSRLTPRLRTSNRSTDFTFVPKRIVDTSERERERDGHVESGPSCEFSYCHAVTRGKNAIVGAAPRDAITAGIRGTRSLMPAIPQIRHAFARKQPLCPLGGRRRGWNSSRIRAPPPLPKSVCLREMCVRIRLDRSAIDVGTVIDDTPVLLIHAWPFSKRNMDIF